MRHKAAPPLPLYPLAHGALQVLPEAVVVSHVPDVQLTVLMGGKIVHFSAIDRCSVACSNNHLAAAHRIGPAASILRSLTHLGPPSQRCQAVPPVARPAPRRAAGPSSWPEASSYREMQLSGGLRVAQMRNAASFDAAAGRLGATADLGSLPPLLNCHSHT